MQYPEWEISEERYEELSKLDHCDLLNTIEKEISEGWRWGYGWYGCDLIKRDGKCYIRHHIGSTCD